MSIQYILDFIKAKWAVMSQHVFHALVIVGITLSGVHVAIAGAVGTAIVWLMHWAHFDGTTTAPALPNATQTTTVTAGPIVQTTVAQVPNPAIKVIDIPPATPEVKP